MKLVYIGIAVNVLAAIATLECIGRRGPVIAWWLKNQIAILIAVWAVILGFYLCS